MLPPGPDAQQLATHIGGLMHGVGGGIAAGALVVLPSLSKLLALSMIYVSQRSSPVVACGRWAVDSAVVRSFFSQLVVLALKQ